MILINLLSDTGFVMTSKLLIKLIGLDSAIFLSELCSEYNYWEEKDKLSDEKWFFSTRENIERNTGLSEYRQKNAMCLLIKKELISIKKIGIPRKIYYKLDEEKIKLLFKNAK